MRFKEIFISFLILILSSCQRDKQFYQTKVFGHAASGLENFSSVYHDNSLEAIKLALSLEGCDGIELDVQIAKDGSVWLYHDLELYTQTNTSGCISQLNSNELGCVKYSSFHNEKLTALAHLDTLILKDKVIFLDLKHWGNCENSTMNIDHFIEGIASLGYLNSSSFETYIITSHDLWIKPLRDKGFNVCFSAGSKSEANQKAYDFDMLDGLVVRNADVQGEDVANWIKTGKKVYIYEVRSAKSIRRAFNKFPSGILSDDLGNALIEKY